MNEVETLTRFASWEAAKDDLLYATKGSVWYNRENATRDATGKASWNAIRVLSHLLASLPASP